MSNLTAILITIGIVLSVCAIGSIAWGVWLANNMEDDDELGGWGR